MYFASHDRLGATGVYALNARETPGCPQRLARCVAIWCDAQRRVVERCDAPRRAASPTVMSISPTRLIDCAETWRGREAASRQRCCRIVFIFVSDSRPITLAPPWQNGFAERQIGSIRRESVDHMIVLGEAHLRRILKSYAYYYNSVRTPRSLNKDAPVSRSEQRTGVIRSRAILGGLHHHYARA